jgi:hypothetical protein
MAATLTPARAASCFCVSPAAARMRTSTLPNGANSSFAKLDARTRSTAVDRARELRLLSSSVVHKVHKAVLSAGHSQRVDCGRSALYDVLAEIEALGLDLVEVRRLDPSRTSPESDHVDPR